jgi:hypothetical protein
MKLEQITETLTTPSVAIPASGAGVVAINFIASLPVILNAFWIAYVFLLVFHKAYKIYREIKLDRRGDNDNPPSE